jgi:hypothetical protein
VNKQEHAPKVHFFKFSKSTVTYALNFFLPSNPYNKSFTLSFASSFSKNSMYLIKHYILLPVTNLIEREMCHIHKVEDKVPLIYNRCGNASGRFGLQASAVWPYPHKIHGTSYCQFNKVRKLYLVWLPWSPISYDMSLHIEHTRTMHAYLLIK